MPYQPSSNPQRRPRRRRRRRRNPAPMIALAVAVLTLCFLLFQGVRTLSRMSRRPDSDSVSTAATQTTPETQPSVIATASILTTGDLLMHRPVITAMKEGDSYNFSPIFRYIREYISKADFAAANLETSLGGPDCGVPYQGAPAFNCPDTIVDAVKEAGFDMLLTANNHCGDTKAAGIVRTLEQIRGRGLVALGTHLPEETDSYYIADINGIKVGMLCYTYATDADSKGRPQLNLGAFLDQPGIVNFYLNTRLDAFYQEVQQQLTKMKAEGAEAVIFYIHWGPEEYELAPNANKQTIAQQLCNLGVDVIIGGHPHVLEPMETLTSANDPSHQTLCLYSMGNAVSNQRVSIESIAEVCPTGHTEDGALFTVNFEKYADGTVKLASWDLLPYWVDYNDNQKYPMIPLDEHKRGDWGSLYNLMDVDAAERSFTRTKTLFGNQLHG